MNLPLVSPFIIFDTVVFDLHSHEVKKARGERKKRKFCLSKASLFSYSDNRSFCSRECRLDFFGSFLYQDKNEHNYSYTGNRLTGISEAGSSQKGFKAASASYDYDVNGNMLSDTGKGISQINYNHLNLPEAISINGSSIDYTYDASGIKMKKVAAGTTTEYSGATVYKDDKLEFIHMPEGYIEPHNNGYRYVYRLTDHSGNTRVSFTKNTVTDQAKALATNDYYPFGLEYQKPNPIVESSNLGQNYKYNGVELNTETELYEMDFRFYDPAAPHFTMIDPLAEERYSVSPYNFAQNNPISRVDPTGLLDWVYDKDKKEYVWDSNVTSADDVDLADNAEYVGVSRDDIDTHFEENNNWFASTFGDPFIDVSSFRDYVGSELNNKIGNFIETGTSQQLDDIRGLNANQISKRLTIPKSNSGFKIIEFNTPHLGLSSPINRTNPGFIGFGKTSGGAREFTLPNQVIPKGSIIKIIK